MVAASKYVPLLWLTAGLAFGQTFPMPSQSPGPKTLGGAIGNVLANKPASESSTFSGSPAAGAAVDGVTDGNYGHGSVTATNQEFAPWWQADLQGSMQIGTVMIWNRTDCCASRLKDYWVFISDTPFLATDTPALLSARPLTFSVHQTAAPGPSTAIVVNTSGHYLRVQLSGTDILSLAEVQAFAPDGTSANAALNKPAAQSSTMPGTPSAAVVVDGNTSGNFYDGSVTATNQESAPWWQVDLGASTAIASIKIWNRTDCCGPRLGDYWLFVSDTPFADTDTPANLQSRPGTASFHQTGAPSPSTSIDVNAQGRYVRVQLAGIDVLSLAEVQVLTAGSKTETPNLALGTSATESSRLPGSPAPGAAIDNNTDGTFYHGSVTATTLESTPWWQLDLQGTQTIGSVKIWNRTDCCGVRLADFWLFVSNT